ncbi:MAG: hypothetical protein CNLJKLNK_01315 [Holosporales bacterium]
MGMNITTNLILNKCQPTSHPAMKSKMESERWRETAETFFPLL